LSLSPQWHNVTLSSYPILCTQIPAGIPQIYHFGQEVLHNILVIDLLGPSLEDLFDMCGRKFAIKTICMAARQMVRLLTRVCCAAPSDEPFDYRSRLFKQYMRRI